MSDQPSSKSSAPDAAKSFTIPSRPSTASAHAPSWKIADNTTERDQKPEYAQSDQHAPQEQRRAYPNMPTPVVQAPLLSGPTFAPPAQPSISQPHWPELSFSQSTSPQGPPPSFPQSTQRPASQQGPRLSEQPFAQPMYQQGPRSSEQSFAQAPTAQAPRPFEQSFAQPSQPPPSFTQQGPGTQRSPGFQHDGRAQLPPVAPSALRKARPGRRVLYLALALIAVLVVLGGLLSQQLLNGGNGGGPQNSALVFSGNGPYAQLPLTADQVNAIQHLAGHMKYKALASLYVSHMSLDDEIGQLIMVEYNQPSYSSDLDYMLNTLHVGGVIMYEFQMTSAKQTKADIAHMQQRANIPLLVSTDEEGGPYVHRLSNIYGYRMSATQIEESGSLTVAKQQGLKTSNDLAALGINEDLAPDVDVNQVNGYDMVTRTFGNTPSDVIKYAGAYLQAMQGNGTVACIKHFPGLGGALTDAHKGLPVVHSTKQQIYDIDLAPFKSFIQSPNALLNPGMIMPTDVLLPAIDAKYPAELSHTFMTDILRNEFGYDGVSLTDALYMQGITDTWDMYTASVMALQAGNDMLLGANGTSQTIGVINAIKQALKDGQLTKARIDESATRIIALKMQYHLMPTYIPGA